MTDRNPTYQKIRSLLASYYSGTTDPAAEKELRELLNHTEPLPADLLAERDLLELTAAEASASLDDIEVPDGLEQKLRLQIRTGAAASRRRNRLRIFTAGIAAAVAAVITLTAVDVAQFKADLSGHAGQTAATSVSNPDSAERLIRRNTAQIAAAAMADSATFSMQSAPERNISHANIAKASTAPLHPAATATADRQEPSARKIQTREEYTSTPMDARQKQQLEILSREIAAAGNVSRKISEDIRGTLTSGTADVSLAISSAMTEAIDNGRTNCDYCGEMVMP